MTLPAEIDVKGPLGGRGAGERGKGDPGELGHVATRDHLDSTLLGVPSRPIGLSSSGAIAGGGNVVLSAADTVVYGGKTSPGGGSSILPC